MFPVPTARRSRPRRAAFPGAVLTTAVAVGVALSLGACSNSPTGEKDVTLTGPVQTEGSSPGTSTSATPSSTSSASLTPRGSSSPSGSTGIETVTITVKGRTVDPAPARVEIDPGTQVRLLITSDVDNVVHVHGLELERPVKAGQQLTWEFVPQQTGVYEVELHDPQLLLFKLSIR